MSENSIHKHLFVFNPKDNGGESLYLRTDFFDNVDSSEPGIFINQKLVLSSYCNAAEFRLLSIAFTPDNLRKLADELECAEREAKRLCKK